MKVHKWSEIKHKSSPEKVSKIVEKAREDAKGILSEEEYKNALEELKTLLYSSDMIPESPQGKRCIELMDMVMEYEKKHYPGL